MPHVDREKLIKIIVECDAEGHLECMPWEPQHWININGDSKHIRLFEVVHEDIYVDILVQDTIDEVDRIIENMTRAGKND